MQKTNVVNNFIILNLCAIIQADYERMTNILGRRK